MRHVQDNAEESVRRVIDVLKDGRFEYAMDHGAVIKVAIRFNQKQRSAVIDFTGTSAQLENNFNAPSAVGMRFILSGGDMSFLMAGARDRANFLHGLKL